MNNIQIGRKVISNNSPTFVIAEAACNHMCDLELAKTMIDKANMSGADAIKFQTYKAERLVCRDAHAYWNYPEGVMSQFEYYKNLDKFNRKDYAELFKYAREQDIIAFSTPFDIESAAMLNDLGVQLFKIASCDLVDIRLIRHIARFGKPLIISTGAGSIEEIKAAIDTVFDAGNSKLILMVCTLSYPADNQDANLRRIVTFREKFPDLIIGLSDHTPPDKNMVIPSVAVTLGAKVIEKHFTLDRTMTGSGHSFSVEPDDLSKMVKNIRLTEMVLGEGEIKVYSAEEVTKRGARRSLVADKDIAKNERIASEMIGIKRPGGGLSPALIDRVIGKYARCNIRKDTPISLEQLGHHKCRP